MMATLVVLLAVSQTAPTEDLAIVIPPSMVELNEECVSAAAHVSSQEEEFRLRVKCSIIGIRLCLADYTMQSQELQAWQARAQVSEAKALGEDGISSSELPGWVWGIVGIFTGAAVGGIFVYAFAH